MRDRALRMDNLGSIRPYFVRGPEPKRGDRIVMLVHGFNNDEDEARASYLAMRSNLDFLLRISGVARNMRKLIQSRIWELYWPGFLPLSYRGSVGLNRSAPETALSAASYSAEVRKARDWVASGLSQYLSSIGALDVFFIAHSLGCRVVLETLARPLTAKSIICSGYLLMAGAVPIDQLRSQARLGIAALRANRRYCLHSWHDTGLILAFPPGQMLAGEFPNSGLPVATGIAGWPSVMWSDHADTKLPHSGYWKEGLFKDNSIASALCEAIFGIPIPRSISFSRIAYRSPQQLIPLLPLRTLPSMQLRGDSWLKTRYG
jgi:hypothetical protein